MSEAHLRGLSAGDLAYIGLRLTHCRRPLFSVLSLYHLHHYHSGMEHRLSKGTNKMKSGTGLYILNQARIEGCVGEGILYVMSSRLNNCAHLLSFHYSSEKGKERERATRSWRGAVLKSSLVIKLHNADPAVARLRSFQRHKIWVVTRNLISDTGGAGLVYMRGKWTSWDWPIVIRSRWPLHGTLLASRVRVGQRTGHADRKSP